MFQKELQTQRRLDIVGGRGGSFSDFNQINQM